MVDITEFPIPTQEFDPNNFIGPQGPEGPQGPQGIQGPQGVQGPQGEVGPDGTPVEIRVNSGSLEWRYVGDVTWQVLTATANLDFSTLTNVTFVDYGETDYATTDPALDRANGAIQSLTFTADGTITLANMAGGKFILADIIDGDLFTVTWPSPITWIGGNVPTLTNRHHVEFYQIGSILFGAEVGSAV